MDLTNVQPIIYLGETETLTLLLLLMFVSGYTISICTINFVTYVKKIIEHKLKVKEFIKGKNTISYELYERQFTRGKIPLFSDIGFLCFVNMSERHRHKSAIDYYYDYLSEDNQLVIIKHGPVKKFLYKINKVLLFRKISMKNSKNNNYTITEKQRMVKPNFLVRKRFKEMLEELKKAESVSAAKFVCPGGVKTLFTWRCEYCWSLFPKYGPTCPWVSNYTKKYLVKSIERILK